MLTDWERAVLLSIIQEFPKGINLFDDGVSVFVHFIQKRIMIKYVNLTLLQEEVIYDIMNKIGCDLDSDVFSINFDPNTPLSTVKIVYAGSVKLK